MADLEHQTHAVTDGPDGTSVVRLPGDHAAAKRIRATWAEFWCTTHVGGCGERLFAVAGDVYTPHFRHPKDSSCAFTTGARSPGAYQHLAYQQALEAWLRDQGLEPHLEHVLDDKGRADLHVVINSISHSIEVQLTTLTEATWDARDARYAAQVDHVQWLHGPECERSRDRDVVTTGDGIAIEIGLDDDGEVLVGTHWLGQTVWSPLVDCRMTSQGLISPHRRVAAAELAILDRAHREFEAWVAEETSRRRAKDELERAERLKRDQERREREDLRLAEAAERRRHQPPTEQSRPEPVTTTECAASTPHPGDRTLAQWRDIHPEMAEWTGPRSWAWLEDEPALMREMAMWSTYVARRLYARGLVEDLHHPELDSPGNDRVVAMLDDAGVIERLGEGHVWIRIEAP